MGGNIHRSRSRELREDKNRGRSHSRREKPDTHHQGRRCRRARDRSRLSTSSSDHYADSYDRLEEKSFEVRSSGPSPGASNIGGRPPSRIGGRPPEQGNESTLLLHPMIQTEWKTILANGLDKTWKSVLLDKYPFPENLVTLRAPVVNNEVLKAILLSVRNKDKFQQSNQNQLGRGITALGAGINILVTNSRIDKETKNSILTLLLESGKILTDVHYNMSKTRRALITPTLNKTIADISKTAPIEQFLFGSDLSERIKVAKSFESSEVQ